MNLQHVNIKLFVENEGELDLERLMVLFHGWVAAQSMNELLIDIADYRHVPREPSVVLVGHEADYSLDYFGGRLGLRYNCKVVRDGDNRERLHQAVQAAAKACLLLEQEFAGLAFDKSQLELSINDRGIAPNTSETLEACRAEIVDALQSCLGDDNISIEHNADPRQLFRVQVSLSKPLSLDAVVA